MPELTISAARIEETSAVPEQTVSPPVLPPAADDVLHAPSETPLPKLQLSILLYLQLAEPITATVIYPFVNQLVKETGITGGDERKTGYFAGLIESAFYATEAICVLQWGRASDRIGRKPVLLGGLLGLTLSMIGFGLSRQYWALVLSRCAEGALNGNIGVTKSMMAEITDPTNRARGFAFLPMIWFVGGTIGPVIGGVLSRPADRWPRAFGAPFWSSYPYFLPCVAAACISISAFIVAVIGLRETLPRASGREKPPPIEPAASPDIEKLPSPSEAKNKSVPASTLDGAMAPLGSIPVLEYTNAPVPDALAFTSFRSILIRPILLPILNYMFLAFIDQSFVVLVPLMYSTSITHGGLGFDSFTIGVVQGVTGFVGGLVSIFSFPWLLRRLGTKRLYVCSYTSFFACFALFPLLASVARRRGGSSRETWAVVVVQFVAYLMTSMTWGCIFIHINDAAPNQRALGLTNGLAQTTASIMRALGPSTASSLFSVTLERHLAGGGLVYVIMCLVVLKGLVASWWLPARLRSEERAHRGGGPPPGEIAL